jgi:hypothetical protein
MIVKYLKTRSRNNDLENDGLFPSKVPIMHLFLVARGAAEGYEMKRSPSVVDGPLNSTRYQREKLSLTTRTISQNRRALQGLPLSPAERRRIAGMARDGLLEAHEFMHLLRPPRKRRVRRPSAARLAALAKRTGVEVRLDRDGTVSFALPAAAPANPGSECSELDAWIAKHHAR